MLWLIDHCAADARFEDVEGRSHRLTVADLVELAEEGRDASSGQRLSDFAARFAGANLTAIEFFDQRWRCVFDRGGGFTIASPDIVERCLPRLWPVQRLPWRAEAARSLPAHQFNAVLADDIALLACLLGVTRNGFAQISNAGVGHLAIERLVERFGQLRETNYGRIYDVIARPEPANLADTALALAPHTDNPYRESPPDYQFLHCLDAGDNGGETLLVDGLAVCEALRAEAPDAFGLLARVPVRFAWADARTDLRVDAPVIACDASGNLMRLRCNDRSLHAILSDDPDEREAWRAAYAKITQLIADPAFTFTFQLAPGDMLILDNRRVLHGRGAFRGARHLRGGYADADGLSSALIRLVKQEVEARYEQLANLFASPAMALPYGEELSIAAHMLQCAALATTGRMGEEIVLAALLHDVGWALLEGEAAEAHPKIAAEFLKPLFGEAIAAPIRDHVAAKRYLVATWPGYASQLSAESQRTLTLQGGPMSVNECAQFAATPGAQAALRLRYLDDAGKDQRAATPALPAYESLLRRRLTGHLISYCDVA